MDGWMELQMSDLRHWQRRPQVQWPIAL